ncbi:MAG: phosphoribosylanthranilate isomerase [Myxococcota bacterium]|nr:phosphoribosylanthranilate isomerase [Myxococcota bacterium]
MKIKVCGITSREQVTLVAEAGADLVGFVLPPDSPRAVDSETARELAEEAAGNGVLSVGIFANDPVDEVESLYYDIGLDVVQLHGNEAPLDVKDLVGRGLTVWKAMAVGPEFRSVRVRQFWQAGAEAVLLDAWHPDKKGGTGEKADWTVAAKLAGEGPIVLAGGLNGGNVAGAIGQVRPWGVDASSGLEKEPGIKDLARVSSYVAATRLVAGLLG